MRPEALPKLLRAIANGTDAKASKQDIIFNAAADEIERMWNMEKYVRGRSVRAAELMNQFEAERRSAQEG